MAAVANKIWRSYITFIASFSILIPKKVVAKKKNFDVFITLMFLDTIQRHCSENGTWEPRATYFCRPILEVLRYHCQ